MKRTSEIRPTLVQCPPGPTERGWLHGLCSCLGLLLLLAGSLEPTQAESGTALAPSLPDNLDLQPWQRLAVQDRGRRKPFTAYAREMTQFITGKSSWKEATGQPLTDLGFVLRLWLSEDQLLDQPTILINSRPLWNQIADPGVPSNHLSFANLQSNSSLANILQEAEQFGRLRPNDKLPPMFAEARNVQARMELYQGIINGQGVRLVPPADASTTAWSYLGKEDITALQLMYRAGHWAELQQHISEIGAAARQYNPALYPPEWLLTTEAIYLQLHPWRLAWLCYAGCAITLGLTLGWQRSLGGWIGYGLGITGFAWQVYGFVCRIIIAGRPPVSNMYESIIWVAFGSVLFALILEAIYRSRFFLLAATPFAVAALIFTDAQPTLFDPSIHPLVAVLNNNFWLSIHVLTITLSYGAFILALGLGHVAIFLKLLSKNSAREMALIYQYNYRSLQIGVLLLAAGTILGGVWANYSWGRFWDWDPKETWALITLLLYLVVLHGRIAGMFDGIGVAIGSILCFQSVVMAWYGVNFVLGTGLHSYGFGTGGLPYAATFVILEVTLVIWAATHQKKNTNPAMNSPQMSAIK